MQNWRQLVRQKVSQESQYVQLTKQIKRDNRGNKVFILFNVLLV